jgi:hypothetical protein
MRDACEQHRRHLIETRCARMLAIRIVAHIIRTLDFSMLIQDEEVTPFLPANLQQGSRHSSNSGTSTGRVSRLPTPRISPAVSAMRRVTRIVDDRTVSSRIALAGGLRFQARRRQVIGVHGAGANPNAMNRSTLTINIARSASKS